jgi:hypothetical protein
MSNLYGVSVVLPVKSKNKFSTAATTKFYLVDESGSEVPIELKGVTSFNIPETGANDILSVSINLPLFEIKYDVATTPEEIARKLAEFRKDSGCSA